MAAVEEELMTVRQRLRDGENVSDALHTLNTLLAATGSGARIQEFASFLSLQLLFETLSTVASSSEELRSLTCRILGKMFASLPPEEVCKQRLYLELGLQHDREEVRRLCLDAISGHLGAAGVREMMGSQTMFHLVTQIVGDDSLHCAGLASELLLAVLAHPASLDPAVRSGLLIDMEGLVAKSDTVRFRVYDLVVRLSLSNDESFEFAVSTRLLHRMLEELQSGDVLVQMNSVELVLSLLDGKQGASFLERQGVVGTMHGLLLSVQNDPLGSIIVPSTFALSYILWLCVYTLGGGGGGGLSAPKTGASLLRTRVVINIQFRVLGKKETAVRLRKNTNVGPLQMRMLSLKSVQTFRFVVYCATGC